MQPYYWHEMLWDGDRVGLNILDTVRIPMMTSFHKNGGFDLTKEWTNISGMVRLYELETKIDCNMFGEILDKSYLLIDGSIINNY